MKKLDMKTKIEITLTLVLACSIVVLNILRMSSSSYSSAMNGYTRMGSTRFNIEILNRDSTDTFTFDVTSEAFHPDLVFDSDPVKNTAILFPFSVANGKNAEDASEIRVEYEIEIITTHSLPLAFKLCEDSLFDDQIVYNNIYVGVREIIDSKHKYYSEIGAGYVYKFYKLDAQNHATSEIKKFELLGEQFDLNEHQLVIEWIADEEWIQYNNEPVESRSVQFAKELEYVELRVTATSLEPNNQFETPKEVIKSVGLVSLIYPEIEGENLSKTEETIRLEVPESAFVHDKATDNFNYKFEVHNAKRNDAVFNNILAEFDFQLYIPDEIFEEGKTNVEVYLNENIKLNVDEYTTARWDSYKSCFVDEEDCTGSDQLDQTGYRIYNVSSDYLKFDKYELDIETNYWFQYEIKSLNIVLIDAESSALEIEMNGETKKLPTDYGRIYIDTNVHYSRYYGPDN